MMRHWPAHHAVNRLAYSSRAKLPGWAEQLTRIVSDDRLAEYDKPIRIDTYRPIRRTTLTRHCKDAPDRKRPGRIVGGKTQRIPPIIGDRRMRCPVDQSCRLAAFPAYAGP